jgi:hypothetical protein
MIQEMISGSASWMITPSATRPATASAFGPYPAIHIGISGRASRTHFSWSSLSFQLTARPFMNSRTMAHAASNSATFIGCLPMTLTAESPRPMPITIRPSERSLSVA